jgi:glutaryl-CoA dehydrogenase
MTPYAGYDLYDVDSLLTPEERMIRATIRSFVEEKVLPIIEEHHEKATFPWELVPALAELGVFGANLPEKYGCANLGDVAYGLIIEELERGDSGLRSCVSVQGALVMFPIFTFGSEEQKDHWLPRLASGKAIGCFGLTEWDFGSNPGGMLTRAERDGKRWVLNGSKAWITNGTVADVAVVWAKTKEGIRGFLVEKGTPGYTARDIERKFSLRASVTSELAFDNCRIPEENLLPGTAGLKSALQCLSAARYGIAWGAVGSALATFHCALDYAKTRIQFEKPIASFQLVQRKLAIMATEITKAQLLAYQLGRLKERKKATFVQVSLAKRNNVQVALDCARAARDILGASGITSEYPVMRHLMNMESVNTYEGTHDIHTLIIGEALTGIPAYK